MKFSINDGIKALLFDCDGTLVDSMPLHMKAWGESFKYFNTFYDYDFLYSLKGMKEVEIIELCNRTFNTNLNPEETVAIKHKYFLENINAVKPIEDVVEVAKHYYGKLPLGVVSGSVGNIVHTELKVIGIHNLFNIILTADDPIRPKPAPDILLAAAEKLSVAPGDCLLFEDGDSGISAALNAGMKVIDVREYL